MNIAQEVATAQLLTDDPILGRFRSKIEPQPSPSP